ncbi:CDP-diacylglycerol--serine O-phosphatidyltransferase [Sphingomonas sp. BE138]|uniref:CDP-alcohol phosphatidyltransferase family protein n=1 Tax=Sphingomonas sp. BE138 TaxID=2817845 RepID=UPI00285D60D9|nr:CDP-alcohol phosphatidyltransferase family protein [Sphingomonas sp. BE138]MDR6790030.1 CDP-diacylglycerol--serine O-phosphatidyltransferase [Sphingomonas sp. BE138]
MRPPLRRPLRRPPGGLPLRAVAPNAVTALALCSGLSGIRFAISANWELAVVMVLIAGVLDGLDGRVARMLHGESRFGAELDSLSDAISFGVSPALILYLWSLHALPRFGWMATLVLAVFCALRLARFNANIDADDQPHKSAGFLTGVPAPAGAALALLPLFLWFVTDAAFFRDPRLVAPWTVLVALLMVSSLATFSWGSLKLRPNIRFEAIAIVVAVGAAAVSAPWQTAAAAGIAYLLALPFSVASYARVKRLRASAASSAPSSTPPPSA